MGRGPCCDKANVKKGPWSPEEDAKLKSFIEKHGTGGNWLALPHKIGLKRCGKSCRLRWLNYLRPNIKHGGFTEDEDNLICSLYVAIGSRWSIIAAQLPGRTDNDIKNYWNTRLKKKMFGGQLRWEPPQPSSHAKQPDTTNPNYYPQVPQLPPPLVLNHYIHDNVSTVEAKYMHDQLQPSNPNREHFGNLSCASDCIACVQNRQKSSRSGWDFCGFDGLLDDDVRACDEIVEELVYCKPQQFVVDEGSNSSATQVSLESTVSRGDVNCRIYPCDVPCNEARSENLLEEYWGTFDRVSDY